MNRIHAIDFTKGILVLLMVVYHSLNYLHYGSLPHDYMAFLPPSFLMITGFLITQIYIPRYGLDSKNIEKRLAVRSLKLLFIFTLLNIMAGIILPKNHFGISLSFGESINRLFEIYFIGNPQMVAFDVLLPISYVLLLSIFILKLQSAVSFFIKFFSIILFTVCILMEKYNTSINNLDLISSGIIGMAIGLLAIELINGFVRSWINIGLLCVFYGSCMFYSGDYYSTQIFSTIISLLIFYAIGVRTHLNNWFPKQANLLGQYSLLSYIIQIAYLKIFLIGTANLNIDRPNIILTIIIIMFVMWVTVIIVDHARRKFRTIHLLYKIVFA